MKGYVWALVATAACTLAGLALRPHVDPVNVAMLYLLPVVIVALRYSRGAAAAAAVLGVLAFDFLFVPPYLSFAVNDVQYLVTFITMLAVGLVIGARRQRQDLGRGQGGQGDQRQGEYGSDHRRLPKTRGG